MTARESEFEMDAPICPHCDRPLHVVVDIPYGFWRWNGERYELAHQSSRVDVSPWACASCLGELRDFHPQDVHAPAATSP